MRENGRNRIIRGIVLAAAVVLIVLGAINHDMKDVWGRAVIVCLECIGIG